MTYVAFIVIRLVAYGALAFFLTRPPANRAIKVLGLLCGLLAIKQVVVAMAQAQLFVAPYFREYISGAEALVAAFTYLVLRYGSSKSKEK